MTITPYITLTTFGAILVRWCVSLSGYSGANKPPMFGDYEAQRHWMEITLNLPAQDWYTNSSQNDLMYWGLDYPPLTAYHSYLCGWIAQYINPDWVALNTSRGHESYEHKLFMRYSVLFADLLVYFPTVFLVFWGQETNGADSFNKLRGYLLMLMYPGLILIDHGHFQYNCISLGLALLAVCALSRQHTLLGSILFCLSLNYKQMELFHAMPFFCYLLGSCLRDIRTGGFLRLIGIGVSVIATFAVCWFPYILDPADMLQVIHRLFPVARGVFEDKVANIWCSLSVIVKWKQIFSSEEMFKVCIGSTLVFLLPSSIDLLLRPSFTKFRYALVNSSLVFFLFSFQVHEKSILIPALIVCTFILEHPFWSVWFLLISTFSMLPLLIKDGLLVPYISTMVIYSFLTLLVYPRGVATPRVNRSPDWADILEKLLFCISMVGIVILSLATAFIPAPTHLPDLFPLIVSVYSCGHFLLFLLFFHYQQFSAATPTSTTQRKHEGVKMVQKSENKSKMSNVTKAVKSKKKKQQ